LEKGLEMTPAEQDAMVLKWVRKIEAGEKISIGHYADKNGVSQDRLRRWAKKTEHFSQGDNLRIQNALEKAKSYRSGSWKDRPVAPHKSTPVGQNVFRSASGSGSGYQGAQPAPSPQVDVHYHTPTPLSYGGYGQQQQYGYAPQQQYSYTPHQAASLGGPYTGGGAAAPNPYGNQGYSSLAGWNAVPGQGNNSSSAQGNARK
jgi:hypothetical protein